MFHFSEWIRTSAEGIRAVGTGFTKGFSRQMQNPGFSQLRGFDPTPKKHISSKIGGLMPFKRVFMDLDSPALGRSISRGVQCGDSPTCT